MSYPAQPVYQKIGTIDFEQVNDQGDPIILEDPFLQFGSITLRPDNTVVFQVIIWEVSFKQTLEYTKTNDTAEPVVVDIPSGDVDVAISKAAFFATGVFDGFTQI